MKEQIEQRKRFIINTAFWALILILIIFVLRYIAPLFLPFIIGFVIAWLLRPLVCWLARKAKIKEKLAGVLITVLVYLIIGLLLTLGGSQLVSLALSFFSRLPEFGTEVLAPAAVTLAEWVAQTLGDIFPDLAKTSTETLPLTIADIQGTLLSISSSALTILTNLSAKIPGLLVTVLFTLMTTMVISSSYRQVVEFLVRQIPASHQQLFFKIRDDAILTVGKYLVAYLKIMFITFLELFIGLSLLGVKAAVFVALGIAIFDILPVLGTGGILLPWALLALIQGEFMMATGVLLLYIFITVIRNIIEPKIVGDQLGMHPLITLVAIYAGFRFMGILGMFLFPVTIQILIELHQAEDVTLWK